MGADLIVTWMPAAKASDKRKEELNEIVKKLDLSPEGDLADYLADLHEIGYLDQFDGSDDEESEILDCIQEHVNTYWSWAEKGEPRDVNTIFKDGRSFYITGGMSWGDEPTDSFGTFEVFDRVPAVWSKLKEWSLHDAMADPRYRPDIDALRAELQEAASKSGG